VEPLDIYLDFIKLALNLNIFTLFM